MSNDTYAFAPKTNQDRVREFTRVMELPEGKTPGFVGAALAELRASLILEEVNELDNAVCTYDLVETADALADLLYVTYGYAITLGIDIDAVFAAVHTSNMAKAPGGVVIRREDGKVLKPEGWEPPTEAIRAILVKDGWAGDAA